MDFNNRVTITMALAAQRNIYLRDWLLAHGAERNEDRAYWAHRIESVNDAAEALHAEWWG